MKENRKTTIPLKTVPEIIEWLLENCTKEELEFMVGLSQDRKNFALLNSIFTRLTDYHVYHLFYDPAADEKELYSRWVSKRSLVSGLKAFSMSCQAASAKKKEKKNG